jgi:cell division protein FtsI (penicillin-binding protein 3)
MSYGYDSKMTPLQILNFYNAVANNGRMIMPHLVKEIRDNGILVKQFRTEILNPMIASRETIGKAQAMLIGVCQNGTGRTINSEYFDVAGKTGTARIATAAGYEEGMYLASFVGYFPADNPQYSMIVTFNNPRNGYYGALVAGPVFKEIAEKVFALHGFSGDQQEEQNKLEKIPAVKHGRSKDILIVAKELELENVKGNPVTPVASVSVKDSTLILSGNAIQAGKVPDVIGMGASNAIFLMENAGLKVKIKGFGKVKQQSLKPGSACRTGQTVYLTLS